MKEFPRTREMLSRETLEHIEQLERAFAERKPLRSDENGPDKSEFDVALAGGGLSLIYAAWLARAGVKTLVFDRRKIGCGHREWNISRRELRPLVESGLFTQAEADALVELEYRRGFVRWHGGGTHEVTGVLDCVISAEKFLDALRAKAEGAGATLLDFAAMQHYSLGEGGVRVRLDGGRAFSARVLLDGTGAASPHGAFDLVCPTVGGVLEGLDSGDGPREVDPAAGEILVTTEDVEDGEQHIWEGFPGANGRFTTYLFYYTEPQRLPPRPLLSLYERFFRVRERYKTGAATMTKPTYGFIPAYSRLRPMPAAPSDRVLLVGDAAARHSPLTFCGFGSMIRSFHPVASKLKALLDEDRLDRRALASSWGEPPGLRVMGGLTLMMVSGRRRAGDPADVNRLLEAAFSTLAEMGNAIYGAFVRDEIGFRDFVTFMRRTAKKRPTIYDEVFAQLSKTEVARWTLNLARLGISKWR